MTNPMNADEYVLLNNTEDREQPKKFSETNTQSKLYISSLDSQFKSDIKLTKLDSRLWKIELDRDFVIGRIGEKMETISARPTRYMVKELEPNIPKWSGINYHPKLSGPAKIPLLRRRNGKKITPHYVFHDPDQRQVFVPEGYHWRCVGKIFVWDDTKKSLPSGTAQGDWLVKILLLLPVMCVLGKMPVHG